MDNLLTAEEVAAWLNVKIATIRQWTSRRKIPHITLSHRAVRYSKNSINEWLQNKTFTERRDEHLASQTKKQRKRRMPRAFDPVDDIVNRAKKGILNNKVG
jgi:excisionase family DNA binding protein